MKKVCLVIMIMLFATPSMADVFNLGGGKFLIVDDNGNVKGATAQTLEQAKQELANLEHNAEVSYNIQIDSINQEIAEIDNALISPVVIPEVVDETVYNDQDNNINWQDMSGM